MPPDQTPDRLTDLFQQYRDACQAPEPGANFMPALWSKIEARQSLSSLFGRWSKGLVTCAVAASLMMGVYIARPGSHASPFYNASYVEVLAVSEALQNVAYAEPVHADNPSEVQDPDFDLL